MATLFTSDSIQLTRNQVISGTAAEATTVRVVKGCVWLTVAGRQQDYWLHAGENMVVPANFLIVIEAYGDDAHIECGRIAQPALDWFIGAPPQPSTPPSIDGVRIAEH